MRESTYRQDIIKNIYRDYAPGIYRICLRVARDRQTALDLRQDVFAKIIKSLDQFQGVSSYKTWVYRIAENHCLDYIRARKRGAFIVCEDALPYNAEPVVQCEVERILSRGDLAPLMRTCLPTTRLIIHLHFVEGYSHQEVAGILGFRRNAVTRRIRNFSERVMNYSPALGKSIS